VVRKQDYEAMESAAVKWVQARYYGQSQRIKPTKPFYLPAPTNENHDKQPRGVQFSGDDYRVKYTSLLPKAWTPNLTRKDTWGNSRGKQWIDAPKSTDWTELDLETKVDHLKKARNRVACWLLTLGFSQKIIYLVQAMAHDCPIWSNRPTFYACENVPHQIVVPMEKIDFLEWEILTMLKLPYMAALPDELKEIDEMKAWFPQAENKAIATITKDNAQKFTPLPRERSQLRLGK